MKSEYEIRFLDIDKDNLINELENLHAKELEIVVSDFEETNKTPNTKLSTQKEQEAKEDDSIEETLDIWRTELIKSGIHKPNIVTISAQWAFLLRLEQQMLELTKSDRTELRYLKDDIRDSFYHFEQYCSNKVDERNSEDLLIHTGIINLESLIKTI